MVSLSWRFDCSIEIDRETQQMTKLRVGIRGVASSAAWFEIVAVTVSDRSAGKTHPEAIN